MSYNYKTFFKRFIFTKSNMLYDLQSLNFQPLELITNDKALELLAMSMDTKLFPSWINPIRNDISCV